MARFLCFFVCSIWVLRTERDENVHDGIKNHAQAIVERIKAQSEELDALNKLLLVTMVEIVKSRPQERKFFMGFFKLIPLNHVWGLLLEIKGGCFGVNNNY